MKPMGGFAYLNEKENDIYTYYNVRIFFAVVLIILTIGGFGYAIEVISHGIKEFFDVLVIVVMPLIVFGGALTLTQYFTFDSSKKTIRVTSFFGLRVKEYNYNEFNRFSIVRNTHNMIYTGTDLKMELRNRPSVHVANYYSTRKIDELMKEILIVLNK
jgi:hypothetical protein